MMSEFIMGNESLKTLSPAFEQRALASSQNSGFTSCTSLLELGELASAGDSSQHLSPHQGKRACESLEHQLADRRAKPAHVAGGPQPCFAAGPSCRERSGASSAELGQTQTEEGPPAVPGLRSPPALTCFHFPSLLPPLLPAPPPAPPAPPPPPRSQCPEVQAGARPPEDARGALTGQHRSLLDLLGPEISISDGWSLKSTFSRTNLQQRLFMSCSAVTPNCTLSSLIVSPVSELSNQGGNKQEGSQSCRSKLQTENQGSEQLRD